LANANALPILPVLDLMHGQIVRGIAGRRDEYRPIVSTFAESAEPMVIAQAFRTHFGFAEFYLADLDAIQHGPPALAVYQQLQESGFRLWIDAGLRTSHDPTLEWLIDAQAASIVVGLESVAGPDDLRRIVERAGADRVVFSLDLKNGRPLVDPDVWQTVDPWLIAEHAITELGVGRLIVLDLARVGVGEGLGTEELCARVKRVYPGVQLTAGGGVRKIDDVKRLESLDLDRVLVASALHDGRITPADVRNFQA
jgi:phosphoribosylformimino-5-aminoimidazole carboxamide ribotide isomerase